jgi:hypothetical protein
MVRRQGKKRASAREEEKKRDRGESSTGLDGPSTREPKHKRREMQGAGAHEPGSYPFSNILDLNFFICAKCLEWHGCIILIVSRLMLSTDNWTPSCQYLRRPIILTLVLAYLGPTVSDCLAT